MLHSLQYLRGIAAMMVVMHHVRGQWPSMQSFLPPEVGGYGVDIFFVISGFIMAFVHKKASSNPLEFLAKRAVRIYPVYWVVTLALCALLLTVPQVFSSTRIDIDSFFMSMLLIPHYSLGWEGTVAPVVMQGWTLQYEMFFYTVFAVGLLFKQRALLVVSAILLVLVTIGYLANPVNALAHVYTHSLLLEFMAGIIVFKIWSISGDKLRPFAVPLIGVGIVGFALPSELSRVWSVGIPASFLVLGVLALEGRRIFGANLLLAIGAASYSIYLWHTFSLRGMKFAWLGAGLAEPDSLVAGLVFTVVAMAASAVMGWLLYLFIEKPLTHKAGIWMSNWLKRRDLAKQPS